MTDNGMAIVYQEGGETVTKLLAEMSNEWAAASAEIDIGGMADQYNQVFASLPEAMGKIISKAASGEGKFANLVSKQGIEEFKGKGIIKESGEIDRETLTQFLEDNFKLDIDTLADNAGLEVD
jgi:hypothetical protein